MIFPNLKAEMSRFDVSGKMVASALGIAESTTSAKLNDPDRISIAECKTIEERFFPGMGVDYLFSLEKHRHV